LDIRGRALRNFLLNQAEVVEIKENTLSCLWFPCVGENFFLSSELGGSLREKAIVLSASRLDLEGIHTHFGLMVSLY
jgi:hypothetical protein